MNNTSTTRSISWLIGLILFFSWNLRAEDNPGRIEPGHLVHSSEIFRLLTPAADLPPLSATATVGVPFSFDLPFLIPLNGTTTVNVTGLPANGLSVQQGSGFGSVIKGTPLTAGVMNLTLVNSQTPSGLSAWQAITLTVNPPLPPLSATATVGVPFSFDLPFLIPLNGTTTVNVTGLPANGLSVQQGSVFGSAIKGTPLIAGVMNLTLVNSQTPSGLSAWKAITLTIDPPLPPLSVTATVGVPFSFDLPFLIPLNGTTTVNVTGLPANGLSVQQGSVFGSAIKGTPLIAGVMNLTLVNSQTPSGLSAWKAITLTIDPPLPPLSATATVGVPFSFDLPFLIPLNVTTTVNVTGLPANGLSVQQGSGFGSAIKGTPLTSGVMNLTLVNSQTPSGLSAWKAITLTVTGGALMLMPPTYNCATGAFRFNTSGGDGSPITFFAIGITGSTTNPDQFVDTDQRTASDAPLILLHATQNGITVTYLWDIRAQCPVNKPGGGLTLLAPTYNCVTGSFQFNTNGGDGSPITFFAIGITGPTTSPDQFVDTDQRTASDAPPILLHATQNGITVTYLWDIRAQCPVTSTPPSSTLTLLAPTYNCATGAFRFNSSGGDGSPVTFFAIGITGSTTNPDQFVDTELRTANDTQPILLQATQNGTTVTYLWNLKTACGRARLSATDPDHRLIVKVLGNPVLGEMVHIEVSGAEGQPLFVALLNQQGHPVSEGHIMQAAATERLDVRLGHSPGVHLLQVSIPGQTEVVRVLKTD
ncbi:hypothetical protein G8759_23910 [Spirosoma aureum]|uniref:T9SS type A sorting domain-containing protein n=1 Tax=Spirosoma aureum TaxID=2692134 RepID=A0A6G9ASJ9_9BACT|nr:hypothetical protein [Spirosoma aureum]QIP15462.1 hypothetical protein G8759_23910 [Spirosoma aureum]